MADNIVIRPIGENEREAWNPLWAGYLAFYETALRPEISDLTWDRFHDLDEQIFALGGYVDGELMAIATTCFTARPGLRTDAATWRSFVAPAARGRGLGRALIEAFTRRPGWRMRAGSIG
jgi:GNAT superfamily N-acetyltransferase